MVNPENEVESEECRKLLNRDLASSAQPAHTKGHSRTGAHFVAPQHFIIQINRLQDVDESLQLAIRAARPILQRVPEASGHPCTPAQEGYMLSMRDCLDYCDLTDDEIELIAEHQDIPDVAAAQLACGLVQTPEGVLMITQYMLELVELANRRGQPDKALRASAICARFMADHPLHH
jgi:hypothetical protein